MFQDNVIIIVIAAAVLVAAYFLYLLILFSLRKIFQKEGFFGVTFIHLTIPILFLLLEIAAFVAIQMFGLSSSQLYHALLVFFIATIGWTLTAIAKAIDTYLKNKKLNDAREIDKQTFITRAHIFYRVVLFLIIMFTLASILMTFPIIRNFGIGILGTAGIAGIALGIAAKPLLENILAGFQIAFTKVLKIGDTIVAEGENGTIEQITLNHIILRTFDLRRIVFPISYFIENRFQSLSFLSREITGIVMFYCDYEAPIQIIREKFLDILKETPLWNGKVAAADLSNTSLQGIEIRFIMSANNSADAFNLGCYVRESLIAFLREKHPEALPKIRYV